MNKADFNSPILYMVYFYGLKLMKIILLYQGGIPTHDLDFLLLYTKSLWLAVAECSGSRDPDSVIVEMCREQFRSVHSCRCGCEPHNDEF